MNIEENKIVCKIMHSTGKITKGCEGPEIKEQIDNQLDLYIILSAWLEIFYKEMGIACICLQWSKCKQKYAISLPKLPPFMHEQLTTVLRLHLTWLEYHCRAF